MTYWFLLSAAIGLMPTGTLPQPDPTPIILEEHNHDHGSRVYSPEMIAHDNCKKSSHNPGQWEARWRAEAPAPYNRLYYNFFSKRPNKRIFKNVLRILRLMRKAMRGYPNKIKFVQNAYRDKVYNHKIGGERRSHHMNGNAIDFHLTTDLQNFSVPQMEKMGAAFNKVGLRVIWYPFRHRDRSVHLQYDAKAFKYRRIYYRGRSGRGYHETYRRAKYAR